MFTGSSDFYDAIYESLGKDYEAEADAVHRLVERHGRSTGRTLLDVACGTGRHIEHLKERYEVEGVDLDPKMLEIAAHRLPGVPLHHADMVDFDLGRRFDVVLNLFSSIGYVRTEDRLRRCVATMAAHLEPGGILLIEPWLSPEVFQEGLLHAHFVDRPDLKVARMNLTRIENGVSVIEFHYQVGTPEGIRNFTERHDLGLFPPAIYEAALEAAGLEPIRTEEQISGRGIHIARLPGALGVQ